MTRASILVAGIPVLTAAVFATAPVALQSTAYRTYAGSDVSVAELEPTGWRITLNTTPPRQVEARTLIADRIRGFTSLYTRGDRLVGIGTTSSAEGVLVWDMVGNCQLAGGMGVGISASPTGRFIAFEEYVPRGAPPKGAVVRMLDVDRLTCREPEHGNEPMSILVDVGDVVLPRGGRGLQIASDLETRSPMQWINGSLVLITRNARTNTLDVNRIDPASKRIAARQLDWQPMASQADLTHTPHPTARFAFKRMSAVSDEEGTPRLRLLLADDYQHKVKWVDVALPAFDQGR